MCNVTPVALGRKSCRSVHSGCGSQSQNPSGGCLVHVHLHRGHAVWCCSVACDGGSECVDFGGGEVRDLMAV